MSGPFRKLPPLLLFLGLCVLLVRADPPLPREPEVLAVPQGVEVLARGPVHEAFASQVLSNVQAWGSAEWARRLGLPGVVGEVDWSRTNVMGGSLAIGHPFAATGARLVTSLSNEMARRDVQFGLISICAQGGMGFAMVLERVG